MNESDIRQAVIAKLSSMKAGQGAAFISELFLDNFSRRADLVAANGKLGVFEIKSSKDTLNRLDGQLETYLRYFEQVTVVCDSKHLDNVKAGAPASVGIWCVGPTGVIRIVRAPRQITIDASAWLSFLPVDELRRFAKHVGVIASGCRSALVLRLQLTDVRRVRAYVLEYLKRRDNRIEALRSRRERRSVSIDMRQRTRSLLELYGKQPKGLTAIPRQTSR